MFDNNQKFQTDFNQYPIAVSNILSSPNKGELLELTASVNASYNLEKDFDSHSKTIFVYSGLITKIQQCTKDSGFYEIHYLGQDRSEIIFVKQELIPFLLEKLNPSK